MFHKAKFCLLMLVLMLGSGCGGPQEVDAPLRIAVLPILDTLPLYVAEAEGTFAAQGVSVELIPAASAAERDQLLQAGQVDGVISDLVALALYNRAAAPGEPAVTAVRYAMTPAPGHAQFRVLASAPSDITSLDALRDVPVGISEGTIIEYVTVRLLEADGVPQDHIATLAVPKIPDRMALLSNGELQAATLPEPLATLALQQGAVPLADDTLIPDISCSVFAFRQEVLDERPQAVRGFLAGISQASSTINADKDRWDNLLTEQQLVPQPIAGSYTLPDYPDDAVPNEAHFAGVTRWLQETDRLSQAPAYEDVITEAFLP